MRSALTWLFISGWVIASFSLSMQYIPNFLELSDATQEWWRDVFINLGTGVVGSVLLIWLYDQTLERRAERDKAEREKHALKRLRVPLNNMNFLFSAMYKATLKKRPVKALNSIRNIYDDDFIEALKYLDWSKTYNFPSSSDPDATWGDVIVTRLQNFSAELHKLVLLYATVLDTNLIKIIEPMIDCGLIHTVKRLNVSVIEQRIDSNVINNPVFGVMFDNFIEKFIELVEIYNSKVDEDDSIEPLIYILEVDAFPLYGSARMDDQEQV